MSITDEKFKDALLGQTREDPKLYRALALDDYLVEIEMLLAAGETEKVSELVKRMRRFIGFLTGRETKEPHLP